MEPRIIHADILYKDLKAIVNFWKALAPNYEDLIMHCNYPYPITDVPTVDVPLILKEGMPAFEKTIGKKRLNALLKHFGYNVEKPKQLSEEVLQKELANLRTIQNAQYYLHGFETLISKLSEMLFDAPENMSTLDKAKYVRLFFYVLWSDVFFPEQISTCTTKDFNNKNIYERINNKIFSPEELFLLYKCIDKNSKIRYSSIRFELSQLSSKDAKRIMNFFEIGKEDYSEYSCKAPIRFKDVLHLKNLVYSDIPTCPIGFFGNEKVYKNYSFQNHFAMLTILLFHPIEDFKKKSFEVNTLKNSKPEKINVEKYVYTDNFFGEIVVSNQKEIYRYFDLFNYMASKNTYIKGNAYDVETKESIEPFDFDFRIYYCLLIFAINRGYITKDMLFPEVTKKIDILATKCIEEFEDNIILDVFEKYWFSEHNSSDDDTLANELGFDKNVEKLLGFERILSDEETIKEFAKNEGIAFEDENKTDEIISAVWLPYFSKEIQKLKKQHNVSSFKKAIGFDDNFKEAYFNLSKLSISDFQQKLINLKQEKADKKTMKKNALTIAMYCYVIQNEIPCGAKLKVPVGNKSLKPTNLLSFITD